MKHLEEHHNELKERYPGTDEGQLWKMAAENFIFEWMDRDITLAEYLKSVMRRIERYFTKR